MTGRGTSRLRSVNLRQRPLDETHLPQFAEALEDAREERAAGHRRHHVIRKPPSKLLGDFKAHRLRAFCVVRAKVDVGKSPPVTVGNLRAQPVHVVVIALHRDDMRAVDGRAQNLRGLEVVRDEDIARQPESSGVGGHASCEVPGGSAPEYLKTQLDGARGRDRYDPVLVRKRRVVYRIVLEIQLGDSQFPGQPGCANERCISRIEACKWLVGGEQFQVAPERTGARFNQAPADRFPDRRIVVRHFQRTEASGTNPQRLGRIGRAAEVAGQSGNEFHRFLPGAEATASRATSDV